MCKKNKIVILILIVLAICLFSVKVYGVNGIEPVEYTQEFKEWLELSEEERAKIIMPRMYEIKYTKANSFNLFRFANLKATNTIPRYSLKDVIPSNLTIRNQQQTGSCWAFAALSSLETNLALSNYKNNINTSKVYDFSERHMEYATSRNFLNNQINEIGYNRTVGEGGNWYMANTYLTNGTGAINESQMPFENNEDSIDIAQIQNKTVTSQVFDTVEFPDYQNETGEDRIQIMNQIKQHIQNYGSVECSIHGDDSVGFGISCYNNDTGAKYCNNKFMHSPDHAVSIIGWDDNYSINNFNQDARPSTNGAWIVRNSWGERVEYDLDELKEEVFNSNTQQCISNGWTVAEQIPDSTIEQLGYTIDGNIAYVLIGDNGIIYISYEDDNVSKSMVGIVKASDTVNYNYIYQYDELYPVGQLSFFINNMWLCNIFNKKTTETEYLTQVSLYSPATYSCKVYVNPNGTSKSKSDLQLIQLKAGESETVNVGYHTLEFLEPVELKASSFAVVIEIQSAINKVIIPIECKLDEASEWDFVKVETGKCFVASGNNLEECQWTDLSKITEQYPLLINGDSTIKAFTTNNSYDNLLNKIEITSPPSKTSYFIGENFDKTGMTIEATYNRKSNPTVILSDSDYEITNGTNLQEGQKSVTITYEGKSVEYPITVKKNNVANIAITTPPNKTQYKAGHNFDKTGMVVKATYEDETVNTVEDYTVKDGLNLKKGQTSITVEYGGKTAMQTITVQQNLVSTLQITTPPSKTNYVVGQDFNPSEMIVVATYEDGEKIEILDYIIKDGENLTVEQNEVTIEFENKTVKQPIVVVEKAVESIKVKTMPKKVQYIQNKESLDLTGGILEVTYNDESLEEIAITSKEVEVTGFNNTTIGKITLILTYQGKSVQMELEIIEAQTAKNSNLDNLKCKISKIQAYTFTDTSKEQYVIVDVEIDNIVQNLDNDKLEYYYYLSTNPNESAITKWIKISDVKVENGKLKFTINTKDIDNYEELIGDSNVYLYIKEVAIKGGDQKLTISKPLLFESDIEVETYLDSQKVNTDNIKQDVGSSESPDDSKSTKVLPNTGTTVSILIAVIVIAGIGAICYKKYKNLKF